MFAEFLGVFKTSLIYIHCLKSFNAYIQDYLCKTKCDMLNGSLPFTISNVYLNNDYDCIFLQLSGRKLSLEIKECDPYMNQAVCTQVVFLLSKHFQIIAICFDLHLFELHFSSFMILFLGIFFRLSQIKIIQMRMSRIKMRGVVMKASTHSIGLQPLICAQT